MLITLSATKPHEYWLAVGANVGAADIDWNQWTIRVSGSVIEPDGAWRHFSATATRVGDLLSTKTLSADDNAQAGNVEAFKTSCDVPPTNLLSPR